MVIEIDGYSHSFKFEKDKKREKDIISKGYRIVRFTENEIIHNFSHVERALNIIAEEIEESLDSETE